MKFFFTALIFLFPVIGYCEDKPKDKKTKEKQRIYMDALVGCAVPLGSYAKADPTNEKAGYATPGFIFQLNIDWLGKNEFGIAFQYNYQYNPYKKSAKDMIPFERKDSLGSGGWSNHYLLIGPVYLKQVNRILIDIKVLGGLILSSCGLFSTIDPASKLKSTNLGMNFGYGFKAGVGYFVTKNISLMVNISFLGGTPKIDKQYEARFIGIDPVTGDYIYTAPVEIQTKLPVSTINACAGILYKF